MTILLEEHAMKQNVLKPFLFVAVLVMLVSLACGIDFGTKTPEPPQPVIQPTAQQSQLQLPTQQPIQPPPQSTIPPPPPSSPFYKEEFNTNVLGDWNNFVTLGDSKSDKNKAKVTIEDGKLVFTLGDTYLYSYLIYDKQTYDNVRVEVSAYNRGSHNNNNISLICRYSDEGWYEFNIASNGMYNILAYDSKGLVHKGYNTLYTSGSNAIRMGNATNVYVAVCSDRDLRLYINGEDSASFTDNKYGFTDGKVGISVSSFNVYPIIVEIDYFDIQLP
jgi:hypothetical protein